MLLLPVTEAIGQAHFRHPFQRYGVQETLDTLGHEMRVIGGEGQGEGGGVNFLVIPAPFLKRVGEVVDLGVHRLLVQVLQQQADVLALRVRDRAA